jgi:hypothetical protein
MWQRQIAAKPINELIDAIAYAGFRGLYIDRYGYEDNGIAVDEHLHRLLNKMKYLESANKRLVFFDLEDYIEKLKHSTTEADWKHKVAEVLFPLHLPVLWGVGVYGLEQSTGNDPHWRSWRWCSDHAELSIFNNTQLPVAVKIAMELYTGYPENSNLNIEGDLLEENLQVNASGVALSKSLSILPGCHIIKFTSDARRVDSQDPRIMVFSINNFSLKAVSSFDSGGHY